MTHSHSKLRDRLAEVEASIARDGLVPKHLKGEQKTIQLQLDRIIYPILTLPPEITSDIFVQCLPGHWETKNPHPDRVPLLLLRICADWRAIALSTPELWAVLHIARYSLFHSDRQPAIEKGIDSWLKCAKGLPLFLDFDGWTSPVLPPVSPSPYLRIIARHASQLRHLKLAIDHDDLHRLDSHMLEFPLLETLSISHNADNGPVRAFRSAPKLREFTLLEEGRRPFLHVDSLPWGQITSFSCASWISTEDCLLVLRLAPLLINLTVRLGYDRDVLPLVSHLHLESLWISGNSSKGLLSSAAFPALHTLTIFSSETLQNDALIPFLSRAPSLRILSSPYSEKLIQALRAAPQLTDVTLVDINKSSKDRVLQIFDLYREPDMLPLLRNILFDNYRCDVDKAVVRVLDYRFSPPADGATRLESFQALRPHHWKLIRIGEELIPHLRDLVAQGLKIHVGNDRHNLL
ncbi:hypothetical protein B0H11DRAFT_1962450 [Mycena galericulata]|nr:hypothetical protein B0H11DRAFT_1962450 [Mycena galericulata]